jgi:hypothetical protein
MIEKKKIPNPIIFILRTPLYEEFPWDGMDVWDIIAIKYFKGVLDCYCPECGKEATFKGITHDPPIEHVRNLQRELNIKLHGHKVEPPKIDSGVFQVILQCARNSLHLQHYIFLINEKRVTRVTIDRKITRQTSITKIGQYPSYADLNLHAIKKYKAVLNDKLLRELSRAIGLASHDVGVGSYVYLRRIFEALIEEAHQIAKKQKRWSEKKYIKSRMTEKIKFLKGYLPTFSVENPSMYSLLSKGIHELSEEECIDHFATLKIGIELILDEKIEKREREQKIQEAKVALQKVAEKIKKT